MTGDAGRRTSHNVRVWAARSVKGKSGTTYELRWAVDGHRRSKSFATKALADSHRAELITAVNRGEPFDIETRLPVSQSRTVRDEMLWWDWALTYIDLKWPTLAPTSRRSTVEALVTCTLAMLDDGRRGKPADAELRTAMTTWAFIPPVRRAGPADSERVNRSVAWLAKATRPVRTLEDPVAARRVLDAIASKKDGSPAAPTTIARKRAAFYNMLDLAVERHLFDVHPLAQVRWKAPRVTDAFDSRSAINPGQARTLLAATRNLGGEGPDATRLEVAERWLGRHLTAFFGCMYYAALRPSEAQGLRLADLRLPDGDGWGELILDGGDPEISGTWTDGGSRAKHRLKHRPKGAVRHVPCPPALVQLLREHVTEFGVAQDGSIFRGRAAGRIRNATYNRIWRQTRRAALPNAATSPLVYRVYDLRHSAVSGWLAAGVPTTQVAAWAGHSVAVLLKIYAHVLADSQDDARTRIEAFLDRGAEIADRHPVAFTNAARCGCGRRIQVTESVLALGPITCGLCGQPFTSSHQHSDQQDELQGPAGRDGLAHPN